MTLESRDKKSLSNIRMAKAKEFLEDAKANLKQKRYKTDVDYGDFETIDKSDAEDSIRITEKIIRSIDNARKKL